MLDAYHYSSRASLDFIGATGFGYDMGSIEHGHGNELAKAFYVLTNAVANFDLMHVLVNIWPILLRVVCLCKFMQLSILIGMGRTTPNEPGA